MEGNKEVNTQDNEHHESHEQHDHNVNQQVTQPHSHESTEATPERKRGFLNRCGVYGLELAVAMITMIITVSVLSFAAFSLGGYLAGADVSESAGYFALWTVASSIVWAPVALIFYLRSRAEMLAKPSLQDNPVQRTFITIYQVVMILTIISFSVSTVFAALMSVVKPEETSDILLSAALPSAVSAILFGLGHVAFYRRGLRRRNFALLFSMFAAVLIVPVVVLSIMSLRSVATDRTAETDLASIKTAVDNYVDDNNKTPSTISDVSSDLSSKIQNRLSNYEYKRVDNNRYQLCADFVASSGYTYDSYSSTDNYTSYQSFTNHGKGEKCFKVKAQSTTSTYDEYDYNR